MTAKDHIKEKLIVSKEDWLREMEEYASIKTKELEKQLQKEAIKQLSLLDQIKELEEENKKLKEHLNNSGIISILYNDASYTAYPNRAKLINDWLDSCDKLINTK